MNSIKNKHSTFICVVALTVGLYAGPFFTIINAIYLYLYGSLYTSLFLSLVMLGYGIVSWMIFLFGLSRESQIKGLIMGHTIKN